MYICWMELDFIQIFIQHCSNKWDHLNGSNKNIEKMFGDVGSCWMEFDFIQSWIKHRPNKLQIALQFERILQVYNSVERVGLFLRA